MVQQTYLVEQARPSSAVQRFVSWRVLPTAIDAAGAIEAMLEAVAERTRGQPILALGLATAAGLMLAALGRRSYAGPPPRAGSRRQM